MYEGVGVVPHKGGFFLKPWCRNRFASWGRESPKYLPIMEFRIFLPEKPTLV